MQARGWTEAGVATDLDVSATKYSPFHRPELARWLTVRAHECARDHRLAIGPLGPAIQRPRAPFGKAMVAITAALVRAGSQS